jgi:hypothetical protein
MPNTLLTATAITREALRVLHQKLNFIGTIVRDYDKRFAVEGAKIGDTLKIRLPNQYVIRRGATLVPQDTKETNVELKVKDQYGVDLNFTSVDLTLSLDDFSERIIEPAMAVLAANLEADAMTMYKKVANQVNNHGNAPGFGHVLRARQMLVDNLAPLSGRSVNLNTNDNMDLVDALKGMFNDKETISKQNREGFMGRTAGFDFMENTLWPRHLRGGANGAYVTNTTAQLPLAIVPVNSLAVATGAGTILAGDVFEIAGVNRVHPETKADTGIPAQFVAQADLAGPGALTFLPAIVTDGAYKNVVVKTPSTTAGVTVAGTANGVAGISMAYHKSAFAFATADMVMPRGVDFASRETFDGISMRIVRQYDINNDKFPCRLDVLAGWEAIRPQLACRLANR